MQRFAKCRDFFRPMKVVVDSSTESCTGEFLRTFRDDEHGWGICVHVTQLKDLLQCCVTITDFNNQQGMRNRVVVRRFGHIAAFEDRAHMGDERKPTIQPARYSRLNEKDNAAHTASSSFETLWRVRRSRVGRKRAPVHHAMPKQKTDPGRSGPEP